MIETYSLLPGVELRCFHDTRFKQGCLSIQLVRPMAASEAAMNALLPSVLLRGTNQHPDLRSITAALDNLYGAAVGPLVRTAGDVQATGLYCSFMDPRFALPGDKILEPMVDFLRELLLDSPTKDGGFLPEFVESEKKNLISAIEAERNDKQSYAVSRLIRTMCAGDSFGLPRNGEKEDVAAIDPVGLYKHYQNILRTSQIQLFYVGSEDGSRMADLLHPLFDLPGRSPAALPPQTELKASIPQHITETMEVAQGKLCLGFTTPITNRTDRFATMQVLNTLYGRGMTSKLFVNVREKQSLCYSIGSSYHGAKGVVTVYAGIDADQREKAQSEILCQLDLCRQGEITDAELSAAKEALISSLRGTHDSPSAIEGYYGILLLCGVDLPPQAYQQAVAAVTREQIAEAASSLTLHSTYFLKGDSAND